VSVVLKNVIRAEELVKLKMFYQDVQWGQQVVVVVSVLIPILFVAAKLLAQKRVAGLDGNL